MAWATKAGVTRRDPMSNVGMPAGVGKLTPASPSGLMASAVNTRNEPTPSVATIANTLGFDDSGLTIAISVTAPMPAETRSPSAKAIQ